jgi:hypothetical protein
LLFLSPQNSSDSIKPHLVANPHCQKPALGAGTLNQLWAQNCFPGHLQALGLALAQEGRATNYKALHCPIFWLLKLHRSTPDLLLHNQLIWLWLVVTDSLGCNFYFQFLNISYSHTVTSIDHVAPWQFLENEHLPSLFVRISSGNETCSYQVGPDSQTPGLPFTPNPPTSG